MWSNDVTAFPFDYFTWRHPSWSSSSPAFSDIPHWSETGYDGLCPAEALDWPILHVCGLAPPQRNPQQEWRPNHLELTSPQISEKDCARDDHQKEML
jgi:hypothetical protein